jgi:hypothetical protein
MKKGFGELYLEKIVIPENAKEKVKKEYEWKLEAAPGIYRMIWYADEKAQMPGFIWWDLDRTEGFKHGVAINYADKQSLGKLNKEIAARKTTWSDYIVAEIDQNPILAASKDTFLDVNVFGIYLWTRNENEAETLLTECSKAIRKLASGAWSECDKLAIEAIEDKTAVNKFTEAIIDNISELKTYKTLGERVESLITKWSLPECCELLGAVSIVPGIKTQIAKLSAKLNLPEILNKDRNLKEKLFYDIQNAAKDFYADEAPSLLTKAFVKTMAKKLAVPLEEFGYGIKFNSIATIIRQFEIDNAYGISLEWYESDALFDAEVFGYSDGEHSDDEFWTKINLSEILKQDRNN